MWGMQNLVTQAPVESWAVGGVTLSHGRQGCPDMKYLKRNHFSGLKNTHVLSSFQSALFWPLSFVFKTFWYSLRCCEVKIVPRIQIRLQRLRGDPACGVLTCWMLTACRRDCGGLSAKYGLVALIPTCALKGQGSFDRWNVLEAVPRESQLRLERLKVSLLLFWKP